MRLSILLLSALWVTPALAGDDIDAAADELAQVSGQDRVAIATQLRSRLGEDGQVCEGEEACQTQLRAQVRECQRTAEQAGQGKTTEEAVEVTAAVMRMARDGEGLAEAGELVRAQLRKKLQADQVGEMAEQAAQMRNRWRKQTMKMLAECAGSEACTGEQAQAAVRTMSAASKRADLDARRVARQVSAAMEATGQKTASAVATQSRMQQRLRLRGEGGTESTVAQGEQHRYRYRAQTDGEGRRGGKYGGQESGGEGLGAGEGTTPGPRHGR